MNKRIEKCVQQVNPALNMAENSCWVSDGEIDSLEILEIVLRLNEEFNVEIPFDEVIPENFESILTLRKMLERI